LIDVLMPIAYLRCLTMLPAHIKLSALVLE